MSTSMTKLGWNQGLVMGPVVNVADPLLCAPRSPLCPSLCCSVFTDERQCWGVLYGWGGSLGVGCVAYHC